MSLFMILHSYDYLHLVWIEFLFSERRSFLETSFSPQTSVETEGVDTHDNWNIPRCHWLETGSQLYQVLWLTQASTPHSWWRCGGEKSSCFGEFQGVSNLYLEAFWLFHFPFSPCSEWNKLQQPAIDHNLQCACLTWGREERGMLGYMF